MPVRPYEETAMRKTAFVLVLIGLAAALATPATAATTKYSYRCDEHLVSFVPGTEPWVEDGALHLRGWTYVYDVVGDARCAGDLAVVVNFNLDLTDWSGNLWGAAMKQLDAVEGGYDITWTAQWTAGNPLDPGAADIWAGRYVGHGYGDLEGWEARATITERTHVLVQEEGYAFRPGE
jgi:hypothetical protein